MRIHLSFRVATEPDERWQDLVNIAREECPRWSSLNLHIEEVRGQPPPTAFLDVHPPSPSSGFEALESIELHSLHTSHYEPLIQALQQAPSLRRAVLRPFCCGASLHFDEPMSLPWKQLTHLELDSCRFAVARSFQSGLPLRETLSALRECTMLQTLVIMDQDLRDMSLDHLDDSVPQFIQLESLRTLAIHVRKEWTDALPEGGEVCLRLLVPGLKRLAIHGVRWNMRSDLMSVLGMIERSGCEVEDLILGALIGADGTVERVLRSPGMKTVKRLWLQGQPREMLFDALAADRSLLPCLEVLELHCGHQDGAVWLSPPVRSILGFLDSRARELKEVRLWICLEAVDAEEVEMVNELELGEKSSGGCKVKINRLSNLSKTGSLRSQVHAIRQLGGLLKETLVLTQFGGQSVNFHENISVIDNIFAVLENRLNSTSFTDTELMWLGEVQYIFLAIASSAITLPWTEDTMTREKARNLLGKFRHTPIPRASPKSRLERWNGVLTKLKRAFSRTEMD
ncbi:hypothetical protein AAF712_008437 [Marasmius tenuissimus]|uniref:Uncharacterized protein n=1 Tax=Marasmius tenuissimus TaxID=585030 RepID=A0ABR2ZSG6_9AGAR